jgi:hypothetical protein
MSARGFMALLNRTMLGQPVVAVGLGFREPPDSDAPDPLKGATLLDRLQAIGAAVSNERNEVIPFQVGKAYALAPATMETGTASKGQDAFDAMGEGLRMDVALTSLTAEDIQKLDSAEGVRVVELSPLTQRALASALRPPLQMPDGTVRGEPLDLRDARLRGRLRLNGISIPIGGGTSRLYLTDSREPTLRPMNTAAQLQHVLPPALQRVPNRFKPSDLVGKSLTHPIGLQGVYRLEDVLNEAGRLVGIKLRAASVYQDISVFVGSRKMAAGEVLDGVRLGATGAFRHVGNDYILAWDKKGLGGVQQSLVESNNFTGEANSLASDANRSATWLTLVTQLPYDEDDPLGLTPEQQRRLFDTEGNPFFDDRWTTHATPDDLCLKITYDEMTPAQQRTLQKAAGTAQIFTLSGRRTVTEEEIRRGFLENSGRIALSLSLSGGAWLPLQTFDFGQIRGYILAEIQSDAHGNGAVRQEKNAPAPAPPAAPKPRVIPTKERGLMTPVLAPGHLFSLAKQMHRHGLNVLFYPALDNGYASFPSRVFPLAPSLREKNGLAAAVAAMKAEGIRVVPYVSVLAWQRPPQSAPHWMSKHSDWLERDVLGRTRLEWAEEHPDGFGGLSQRVLGSQDFVRASEPKVAAKLKTFVAELLAQPGLDGLCLMDWNPNAGRAPRLGFAMADRLAAIAAGDDDPVDLPINPDRPGEPFWPESFAALGFGPAEAMRKQPKTMEPRQEFLARGLLDLAKQRKPALKTYLLGSQPAIRYGRTEPARPLLTEDVSLVTALYLDPFMTSGILLPAWPQSIVPPSYPAEKRDYPAIVSLTMRPSGPDFPATFTSPIAVLDFRATPEDVSTSLEWILPATDSDKTAGSQSQQEAENEPRG